MLLRCWSVSFGIKIPFWVALISKAALSLGSKEVSPIPTLCPSELKE